MSRQRGEGDPCFVDGSIWRGGISGEYIIDRSIPEIGKDGEKNL